MFLVQSHIDLPSTFGGQANVPVSRLVRRAIHVDLQVTILNIHQLMIFQRSWFGRGRGKCIWT